MTDFALFALVILLGLGAYWAMVIFPKQRDFIKRQRAVRELQPGDEVVTYGGIIGTVISIDAEHGLAQVEIAPGVIVRLLMAAVLRPYDANEVALAARMGDQEAD